MIMAKKGKVAMSLVTFIIAIAFFATLISISSENVQAQQLGCCLKTKDNEFCSDRVTRDQCEEGFFFTGKTCENINQCRSVTCIHTEGECQANIPQFACQYERAKWDERPLAEVEACQTGGCNIGNVICEVLQKKVCEDKAKQSGFPLSEVKFTAGLTELEVKKQCVSSGRGTCELGGGVCEYTTADVCANKNGKFNQNILPSQVSACGISNARERKGCGILPGDENKIFWFNDQGAQEALVQDCGYPSTFCKEEVVQGQKTAVCKSTACEFTLKEEDSEGRKGKVKLLSGTSICYNFHTDIGGRSTGLQHQILHCVNGNITVEGLGPDRNKRCVDDFGKKKLSLGATARVVDNLWKECRECGEANGGLVSKLGSAGLLASMAGDFVGKDGKGAKQQDFSKVILGISLLSGKENTIGDTFQIMPLTVPPGPWINNLIGSACGDKGGLKSIGFVEDVASEFGFCKYESGLTGLGFALGGIGSAIPKVAPGNTQQCNSCGGGGDALWNVCDPAECNALGDCEAGQAFKFDSVFRMWATGAVVTGAIETQKCFLEGGLLDATFKIPAALFTSKDPKKFQELFSGKPDSQGRKTGVVECWRRYGEAQSEYYDRTIGEVLERFGVAQKKYSDTRATDLKVRADGNKDVIKQWILESQKGAPILKQVQQVSPGRVNEFKSAIKDAADADEIAQILQYYGKYDHAETIGLIERGITLEMKDVVRPVLPPGTPGAPGGAPVEGKGTLMIKTVVDEEDDRQKRVITPTKANIIIRDPSGKEIVSNSEISGVGTFTLDPGSYEIEAEHDVIPEQDHGKQKENVGIKKGEKTEITFTWKVSDIVLNGNPTKLSAGKYKVKFNIFGTPDKEFTYVINVLDDNTEEWRKKAAGVGVIERDGNVQIVRDISITSGKSKEIEMDVDDPIKRRFKITIDEPSGGEEEDDPAAIKEAKKNQQRTEKQRAPSKPKTTKKDGAADKKSRGAIKDKATPATTESQQGLSAAKRTDAPCKIVRSSAKWVPSKVNFASGEATKEVTMSATVLDGDCSNLGFRISRSANWKGDYALSTIDEYDLSYNNKTKEILTKIKLTPKTINEESDPLLNTIFEEEFYFEVIDFNELAFLQAKVLATSNLLYVVGPSYRGQGAAVREINSYTIREFFSRRVENVAAQVDIPTGDGGTGAGAQQQGQQGQTPPPTQPPTQEAQGQKGQTSAKPWASEPGIAEKTQSIENQWYSVSRAAILGLANLRGGGPEAGYTCRAETQLKGEGTSLCKTCASADGLRACTKERCEILGLCKAVPKPDGKGFNCVEAACEQSEGKKQPSVDKIEAEFLLFGNVVKKVSGKSSVDAGLLPWNVTEVRLKIQANVGANCRFSTTPGGAWSSSVEFEGAAEFPREQQVTLAAGGAERTHNIYIKCQNICGVETQAGNDGFFLRYEKGKLPDFLPPEIAGIDPYNVFVPEVPPIVTTQVFLSENGGCFYTKNLTVKDVTQGGQQTQCAQNQKCLLSSTNTCATCKFDTDVTQGELMDFEQFAQIPEANAASLVETARKFGIERTKVTRYVMQCQDAQGNKGVIQPYMLSTVGNYNVTILSPAPGFETFDREVTLRANTTHSALCKYSLDVEKNFNEMTAITGEYGLEHEALIGNLSVGEHNIFVACEDFARQVRKASMIFKVKLDTQGPVLIRAFRDFTGTGSAVLKIVTDEVSSCRYSINNPSFAWESGIEMPFDNSQEHIGDWGFPAYYIRCRDRFSNEMYKIIRPSEIG